MTSVLSEDYPIPRITCRVSAAKGAFRSLYRDMFDLCGSRTNQSAITKCYNTAQKSTLCEPRAWKLLFDLLVTLKLYGDKYEWAIKSPEIS